MIRLIDDYGVLVDAYNYSLVTDTGETRTNKKGEETPVYRHHGHYGSLSQAIKACRRKYIRDRLQDGCTSLVEAEHTILEADKRFEDLLGELAVGGDT